jgi:FtsZ-binding cell division protein ZapB
MSPTSQQLDVDTLGHLEERIQQTVTLVTRLRADKESLTKDLAETKAALDDATSQNLRLTGELEALQDERTMVRGRIEKLLGHIDTLGA